MKKTKEEFYNFIIHIDNVIANIEAQKIISNSQLKNNTFVENKVENKMKIKERILRKNW